MERTLVEQAQNGDREAFSQIAFAISPRLFAVAQRIMRDYHRAEDITQLALIQIWRTLPSLRDVERFDAWSYRVLVNTCYVEMRRSRREAGHLHLVATDVSGSDDEIQVAQRDMLERAFDRLSPQHRAVLVLMYYQELPLREIAGLLDIPLGTVKSRASSGRAALRGALEADARAAVQGETA